MKLLVDLNLSPRVAAGLRAAGHHVVRVGEELDARATDLELVAEAKRTGSVVVSRDQDFSALLIASGARAPSLINLRTSEVRAEQVTRFLLDVLERASEELAAGAVVTIDDRRIRIRRLPVA